MSAEILIIDDNSDIRLILKELISEAGYHDLCPSFLISSSGAIPPDFAIETKSVLLRPCIVLPEAFLKMKMLFLLIFYMVL